MKDEEAFADGTASVKVSVPVLLTDGFCAVERYNVELTGVDGAPIVQNREVVRVGGVVGVLAVDLDQDEVVLIRQFRLAAHLATGQGELLEIVAGHVKPREDPAAAARRECLEELGVPPIHMVEIFSFMPSPGLLDEHTTMFLASVDASKLPKYAGVPDETEQTRPVRFGVDASVLGLSQGKTQNGYLILALQWLALNRADLKRLLQIDAL